MIIMLIMISSIKKLFQPLERGGSALENFPSILLTRTVSIFPPWLEIFISVQAANLIMYLTIAVESFDSLETLPAISSTFIPSDWRLFILSITLSSTV